MDYPYGDDIPEMTLKATHVFGSMDTPAAQCAPGIFADARGAMWHWWRWEFRLQPSDVTIKVDRAQLWSAWNRLGPLMPEVTDEDADGG